MIELEDWQWADASSERLLRALSRRNLASAITLVLTQREPSEGATVAARPGDVVIDLRELGDDVVRDVAAAVLARTGRGADPEQLERIVTLGAGNPLMVETLVDVGDEGVLTTGLAPLLQARLDRLPDEELRPLLWASAFGRAVDPEELGAAMDLGGDAEPNLVQLLDGLVAAGMLAAARPADAGLGFRHASVREAAYERLSHGTRRRVHHSVARTLEERSGAPVEIAGHLLPTDDVERQRRWYPLAGSRPVQRGPSWTRSPGSSERATWVMPRTRCGWISPVWSWCEATPVAPATCCRSPAPTPPSSDVGCSSRVNARW